MSQHLYYNALNRFYQANYGKTESAWNKHHDWHAAWRAVAPETSIDPQEEWERLLKHGVRLFLPTDADFPPLLTEIARAPFGLYIVGAYDHTHPTVALVGTRRATSEGLRIAKQFACNLATQGIVVASGLALGIDGAAHAGALTSGACCATVAVLPCGLDDVYPKSHANLANEIVRTGGALISEYPFGTQSFPLNFLERNRIVSGISSGTVVIEAPVGSGALVTAKLALDQNREVFAVPGPISHPNYIGPHRLIKEGACLVTCAEDVCDALGLLYQKSSPISDEMAVRLSPHEQLVLAAIKGAGKPLTVDAIATLTAQNIQTVNRAVAMLIINGTLKEQNGAYSL